MNAYEIFSQKPEGRQFLKSVMIDRDEDLGYFLSGYIFSNWNGENLFEKDMYIGGVWSIHIKAKVEADKDGEAIAAEVVELTWVEA